jgi:hypothetical protein
MTTVPLIATGLTALMSVYMVFHAALDAESFAIEIAGSEELKMAKEHAPKLTEMVLSYNAIYNFVQAVVNCFIFAMVITKTIPAKLAMALHLAYWTGFGLAAAIVNPWPSTVEEPFKLFGMIPFTDATGISLMWFSLSLGGLLTASGESDGKLRLWMHRGFFREIEDFSHSNFALALKV